MSQNNLQTLKGFRDFDVQKMVLRNIVINKIKTVFEKYGFDEIQTPTIEYQETLLGKYGKEAEKLMYLFEDPGKRKVGLKYDLTVPTARFVANNPNLLMPFKRYQIQPVWRADKPQKGRYREIYQCDIDIIGSHSPISDAQVIAVIDEILKFLKFPEYKIRVNSRKVLFDAMKKSNIDEKDWLNVIQSIDKLDKKTKEEVFEELTKKGFSELQINKVFENLQNAQPDENLQKVLEISRDLGTFNNIAFDPTLSRGLDYYTGAIFETVVTNPKIGSVTGGGRYDKLLSALGGPDLPAVGTTIGLDRIVDVISELNLWETPKTNTNVLIVNFSNELVRDCALLSSELRSLNINTDFYDSTEKLEKQFKYADKKGIKWVVILGNDEIRENNLTIKNLSEGYQETLPKLEALEKIRASLLK